MHEFKTLKCHIAESISKLELKDFEPPIDHTILFEKLEKILEDNTPFWYKTTALNKNTWKNWLFYLVKSFKDRDPIHIGIMYQDRYITLVVFDEFLGSGFNKELKKTKINLIEAWINHEIVYKEFAEIFTFAIKKANDIE